MSTPLQPAQQALLQQRVPLVPVIEATAAYGTETVDLTVIAGSVTLDRRRKQWATANLQVSIGPTLPLPLTQLGGTLSVRLGLRSVNGSQSTVPVITDAPLTNVGGLEVPNAVVAVSATEASEWVTRYRFEQPFSIDAATDLAQVINLVLNNRGLPSSLTNTGVTLTAARVFGLDANSDPWTECVDLAAGFGWRLHLGRAGIPMLDQQPTGVGTARDVLVLNPQVTFDNRPPNVVVGRWEPTDGSAPVRAVAEDLDPASPTFVGGPYRRVTTFFASSLPISQAGADQAVQTLLRGYRYQGGSRTWVLPFDPTIDPDDVLTAPGRPRVIVEAVTFDLAGGTTVEVSEAPT